jgi:uroporphyrinogen-III synthase
VSLIPFVVPPLQGLRILVTRPADQAAALSEAIRRQGGDALLFASIAIEAVPATAIEPAHDWIVFLSANAVRHSASILLPNAGARIAAIGNATARALHAASWTVDLVPPPPHTSETLLSVPDFAIEPNARVLIVRGEAGRETLDQALLERGAQVDSLVVYRRVPAAHTAEERERLERDWQEHGIDVVTVTSADTLIQLHQQLSDVGQRLLRRATLLVASPRIIDCARALGLTGECVLAPSAEDTRLVAALAHWCARAR